MLFNNVKICEKPLTKRKDYCDQILVLHQRVCSWHGRCLVFLNIDPKAEIPYPIRYKNYKNMNFSNVSSFAGFMDFLQENAVKIFEIL